MKTHKKKKNNISKRNVKRAARLMYELKIRGITQKKIAEELGMTRQAVGRSFQGLSTITRVDEWLAEHIGTEVLNVG